MNINLSQNNRISLIRYSVSASLCTDDKVCDHRGSYSETRECFRDGDSVSRASLRVETITYLDVETALRCCQRKYRIGRRDVSMNYYISFAYFTSERISLIAPFCNSRILIKNFPSGTKYRDNIYKKRIQLC